MKRKSLQGALLVGIIVVCAMVCMGCASFEMTETYEPKYIVDTSGKVMDLSGKIVDSSDNIVLVRVGRLPGDISASRVFKEVDPDVLAQESIDIEEIFEKTNPDIWYTLTVKRNQAVFFIQKPKVYQYLQWNEQQAIQNKWDAEQRAARQAEQATAERQRREQEAELQRRQTAVREAQLAARQQAEAEANRQQQPPENTFMVKQNADNTITITGYRGTARNIIIPDTLFGLKTAVISDGAFRQKGLIGVIIPDTITAIGQDAFQNNADLQMVTIGKAVQTIASGAFSGTALTELVFPDSVTTIGPQVFSSRYMGTGGGIGTSGGRLTKVQFGRGLKTIGEYAFASHDISAPLVIPNGVTLINEGAFMGNDITELVIPASLARYAEEKRERLFVGEVMVATVGIADWAFRGCPLTRVTLPANMDERNMKTFEEGLVNFWKSQNKAAGVYVKNGPVWSRQ